MHMIFLLLEIHTLNLLNEKKLGGRLVTIIIRGDVSAVTQAIEAAAADRKSVV